MCIQIYIDKIMTLNFDLYLSQLPKGMSLNEGIYLFYKPWFPSDQTTKKGITFSESQKINFLKKYSDPIILENALKILINLPSNISYKNIIKSIDYNLNFRNKFKPLKFKDNFLIKVSTHYDLHNFYNGTQYNILYKNEQIANFNFLFTYENNSLTLRLKNIQGVKGKGKENFLLSSKLNKDWGNHLILFLKKYAQAKKMNYIFEIPTKYLTTQTKIYEKYIIKNYLEKYLKNNISASNIDYSQIPYEYQLKIKKIISKHDKHFLTKKKILKQVSTSKLKSTSRLKPITSKPKRKNTNFKKIFKNRKIK